MFAKALGPVTPKGPERIKPLTWSVPDATFGVIR
jgi:hypothetical protein